MKRMNRKRNRSDAGFTLVELMVASGIIGVSMAMTMGSLISVATAQRTTEADAIATSHTASILEDIRNTTSLEDVLTYVAPQIPGLGSSKQVWISVYDSTGTEYDVPMTAGFVPTGLPNPMLVQVNILWIDAEGRDHGIQAFTYHRRL